MSATATEALAALREALEPLIGAGIRLHPYGVPPEPPASIVGPPTLTWETYSSDPTEARFVVYLVAAFDDRAVDRLLELLPLVFAAVEGVPGATVDQAHPTTFTASGPDLPAYSLPVSFVLS